MIFTPRGFGEVYLKTWEVSLHHMAISHTCSLAALPHSVPSVSKVDADPAILGRMLHQFMPCAACRYLSWASPAKVHGHPSAFVSTQLSGFWDLSLVPRSFLQTQLSPFTSSPTFFFFPSHFPPPSPHPPSPNPLPKTTSCFQESFICTSLPLSRTLHP